MQRTLFAVVGVGVLSALAGCGSSGSQGGSARVEGTVTRTELALANARAVAIASDGKRYWALLDAWGNFTLNLPTGKSYRVLIVNATDTTTGRVAGHVVIATSAGTSRWINLDSAGTLDLGNLKLAATSAGAVTTQSEGLESDGAEGDGHDADPETHAESDDDEHEDVCTGTDDQELHPSNEPGDRATDRHASDHEDADGNDREDRDDKACAASPAG